MTGIAKLNRLISDLNIVAFKHASYFYFMHGDRDDFSAKLPTSVYTLRFSTLTLKEWEAHVRDAQPNKGERK